MTDVSDPLRFLNLKKKRQSNKQKGIINLSNKPLSSQQAENFILPSFNSQNSLECQQIGKIKKKYNPLKYFNADIQDYINKLKVMKIANSPIMPENYVNNINEKQKVQNNFKQPNQQNHNKMMTFAKNQKINDISKQLNQKKISFNFNNPGLKKSGSMRMVQKIQQQTGTVCDIQKVKVTTKNQISPWELPEYLQTQHQLKQCSICGRKFNLQSHAKHVNVCEKVFFKKRKPFNSRSNSKQKNMNRK